MNSRLSDTIRETARSLGFQLVGITPARTFQAEKENLEEWLKNRRHGDMEWLARRKDERGSIFNYYPEARSVISVAINYYTGTSDEKLDGDLKFSNYAWGEDYHYLVKDRLLKLLEKIKAETDDVSGLACVDTSPVMEKVWAQRAGLGWQGKHTNLITRDYGSWLFLGELILDTELEYDDPFDNDLCGDCTACIDACPTAALEPYQLDAGKCISYLTIEHRGDLPRDLAGKLSGWIYGCDICQEVCPWNIKFARISSEKDFQPRPAVKEMQRRGWESLTADEFRQVFRKSAVKRTKHSGLIRNIYHNK